MLGRSPSGSIRRVIPAFAALVLLVPLFALSQENSLRAVIEAQLRQDSETASLSQAEFDAMVSALVAEAQSSGVSQSDLTFTPPAVPSEEFTPVSGGLSPLQKTLLSLIALGLAGLAGWFLVRWLRASESAPSQSPPVSL
jgi:hypothetical protein